MTFVNTLLVSIKPEKIDPVHEQTKSTPIQAQIDKEFLQSLNWQEVNLKCLSWLSKGSGYKSVLKKGATARAATEKILLLKCGDVLGITLSQIKELSEIYWERSNKWRKEFESKQSIPAQRSFHEDALTYHEFRSICEFFLQHSKNSFQHFN